jgi:hypothetical protein
MRNIQLFQLMYQQWIQENEYYVSRWKDFIELAVRETNLSGSEILNELEQTTWFERTYD